MGIGHVSGLGLAVLVAATWPFAVHTSAQERLAAAKSLRCTFARQATGTFNKDGTAGAVVRPASLVLRFEGIDPDTGTAKLRNGSMLTDVTVQMTEGYLHVMQAFRTGPLYTTTVFSAGVSGGTWRAVHSRHEYFAVPLPGSTSSPEQYYGECETGR